MAFVHVFEKVAQDDALDLLDQLITQCLARAETAGEKERLRTIRDLDAAALRLCEVAKIVVNEDLRARAVVAEQELVIVAVLWSRQPGNRGNVLCNLRCGTT